MRACFRCFNAVRKRFRHPVRNAFGRAALLAHGLTRKASTGVVRRTLEGAKEAAGADVSSGTRNHKLDKSRGSAVALRGDLLDLWWLFATSPARPVGEALPRVGKQDRDLLDLWQQVLQPTLKGKAAACGLVGTSPRAYV